MRASFRRASVGGADGGNIRGVRGRKAKGRKEVSIEDEHEK